MRNRWHGRTRTPNLAIGALAAAVFMVPWASPPIAPAYGSHAGAALWPAHNLPSGILVLTPPYSGFTTTHLVDKTSVDGCSASGGGGWGFVHKRPSWDPKRGELTSWTNVSTSTACWTTNTTSAGFANTSVVQIETSVEISHGLNLTAGLGGVTVGWNVSAFLREAYTKTLAKCTYNRTLVKLGATCLADSYFSLAIGFQVIDSTANTTYCPGYNQTGVCGSVQMIWAERGSVWPCSWTCKVGSDNRTSVATTSVGNLTDRFFSGHNYSLELWMSTRVYVALAGWEGHGLSLANVATQGHGVTVGYIRIW
jgi:hypothetical protein